MANTFKIVHPRTWIFLTILFTCLCSIKIKGRNRGCLACKLHDVLRAGEEHVNMYICFMNDFIMSGDKWIPLINGKLFQNGLTPSVDV